MLLPLREYTQVVSALKASGAGLAAEEARKSPRLSVTARVDVHMLDSGKLQRSITALTRNLSRGGIALIQSVEVQKGQEVIVTLPRELGALRALSRVVSASQMAEGVFFIGLEFVAIMEKADPAATPAVGAAQAA